MNNFYVNYNPLLSVGVLLSPSLT